MIAWVLGVALAADTEIVVEAPLEPADSSASVTVIEVDEDLPAATDVAAAVGAAPGTAVRRLGGLGDFAAVSIRGSAARQVEVYLDGIPLNPEGVEVVNLSELPIRAFERVEVYRGSAPPELGGSPIGGVIHLITGDREGLDLSVGGGSWNTVTGTVSGATSSDGGDVLVVADGLHTEGAFPYLDDRGTASVPDDDVERVRRNNDRQQGTLTLRVRRGPWTVLSAGLAKESGVPGFTWLPSRQARVRILRELLALGWEHQAENATHQAVVWGRLREEKLSDPAAELSPLPQDYALLIGASGGRFSTRWAPSRGVAWVGAGEVRTTGLRSDAEWITGRLAGEGTAGAVIRDASERVAVSPVLQATVIRDAASGDVESLGFLAPRAGLLVGLTEHLALAANGGRYLRAPDPTERFGNQGVLVGNPDLRPERGLQADLGFRAAAGDVRGELVGFAGRAVDRIGYLQNAAGLARPANLDAVRTVGAELASQGDPGPVSWTASLTWTRALQQSELPAYEGQSVAGIPEWEWHHRLGLGSAAVGAGWTLDATTGTPLDQAGIFVTAPRWIHGANARVSWRAATLELDVLNLLDRRTEETPRDPLVDDGTTATRAVTDFFGYPLPGRTFLLFARFSR